MIKPGLIILNPLEFQLMEGKFWPRDGQQYYQNIVPNSPESISKPTSAAAVFSGVPTVKWMSPFLRGICFS